MERIRVFIAVSLPQDVIQTLTGIETRLKSASRAPVKWVEPRNLHLTLKFLGNVVTDALPDIGTAMQEAARGCAPFTITMEGLGAFPDTRRVNVVWAGLGGDTGRLADLQRRIEEGLEPLGFAAENRGFTPHLTIGRVRDHATPRDRQELGDGIARMSNIKSSTFVVREIHLFKSRLTPEGPHYTCLTTVTLS